jgi:molecular chaperone GrpE
MLTKRNSKTEAMTEKMNQNEELNDETTNQEKVNENQEIDDADNSTENNGVETPSEDQLAVLNDKYLRLYSEFDNYRKRTNKEKLDLISTASAGVLKDMLGVLDDFERAIANNENVDDIAVLKEGFKLIYSKMKSILEAKGLKQMEAKHTEFNADFHEAIANIPAPSDELKGKVIDDVEKGYFLNEKVIRFAKVVVGN